MIDEKRFALLIACNEYNDPDFKRLKAPQHDAQVLADVLKDPSIGGFQEARIVSNQPYYTIYEEIYKFFNDRRLDDLSLLYFAGQGMKGEDSELYFAVVNTTRKLLAATAISSTSVNKAMLNSRSKRQVLLLDCCNSGAFPKGNVARSSEEKIQTNQYLQARGRVILTASDAMQYAFEGDDLIEKGIVTSIFTQALIQGLKTGEADLDDDGVVSHNDLYKYLFDYVTSRQPQQTPCMWADIQGAIVLAQKKSTAVMRELPKSRDKEFMIKLLQDGKIEQFNTIRKVEDMPLNLRNVDLSKKMLVGVDLHDADLTDAILTRSVLGMANLNGAKLIGANLKHIDLRGANLQRANLTKADLSSADLRTADVTGMVDFSEANLSSADLRVANLNGMVNFRRAILDATDFTGSTIDKDLMYLKEATIHNVRGLPNLKTNEYLEALKSYSEAISHQFKTFHTPTFRVLPIEEKMKDLVKEAEKIEWSKQISLTKKKNLTYKFFELTEKVMAVLPDTSAFDILAPFDKLIQLRKIVEAAGWYSKGETNYRLARYDEASICYDKAIEIKPDYANAWYGKSNVLRRLHRYEDSIKYYDKAIETKPDYADAWYGRGVSFKLLKKYDEANKSLNKSLKYYDKIIETKPDDAHAWYAKGFVLGSLDKFEDSMECLDKAIKIQPDNSDVWIQKGCILSALKRYDEAIKSYDKAIETEPDRILAWLDKGVALQNLGRHEEAIQCYNKAIEIQPKYLSAWYNRGNALSVLKRYDEAIKSYDKALEIDPNYAKALNNKGVALQNLEKQEAMEWEAINTYANIITTSSNANAKEVAWEELEKLAENERIWEYDNIWNLLDIELLVNLPTDFFLPPPTSLTGC